MKNIAIIARPELGHMMPILGVASELARRDYTVCIFSHISSKSVVSETGLPFVPICIPDYFSRNALNIQSCILSILQKINSLLNNIDLLICESGTWFSMLAELLNIPWVTFSPCPHPEDEGTLSTRQLQMIRAMDLNNINYIRNNLGLSDYHGIPEDKGISPYLHLKMLLNGINSTENTASSTEKIVGVCSLLNSRISFEPLISIPDDKKSFPVIMISTSSLTEFFHITQMYLTYCLKVFSNKDYVLVITGNSHFMPDSPLSENIIWITECPSHDHILPKVDAVITHGGNGTIQKSLVYGKPMLIIPLGYEHSTNARKFENLDVAITLRPSDLTELSIEKCVHFLLFDPKYKHNATKLSNLHLNNASNLCVDYIIEMIQSTRTHPLA